MSEVIQPIAQERAEAQKKDFFNRMEIKGFVIGETSLMDNAKGQVRMKFKIKTHQKSPQVLDVIVVGADRVKNFREVAEQGNNFIAVIGAAAFNSWKSDVDNIKSSVHRTIACVGQHFEKGEGSLIRPNNLEINTSLFGSPTIIDRDKRGQGISPFASFTALYNENYKTNVIKDQGVEYPPQVKIPTTIGSNKMDLLKDLDLTKGEKSYNNIKLTGEVQVYKYANINTFRLMPNNLEIRKGKKISEEVGLFSEQQKEKVSAKASEKSQTKRVNLPPIEKSKGKGVRR